MFCTWASEEKILVFGTEWCTSTTQFWDNRINRMCCYLETVKKPRPPKQQTPLLCWAPARLTSGWNTITKSSASRGDGWSPAVRCSHVIRQLCWPRGQKVCAASFPSWAPENCAPNGPPLSLSRPQGDGGDSGWEGLVLQSPHVQGPHQHHHMSKKWTAAIKPLRSWVLSDTAAGVTLTDTPLPLNTWRMPTNSTTGR